MSSENKYYYINYPSYSYSNNRDSQLIKWNKRYYVEVDENVDYHQAFSVTVNKFKGDSIVKPKSTEYEKVKPILEDVFLDHYNLGLRNIARTEIEEGEFYLIEKRKTWYMVEYYYAEKNDRRSIKIDLRDGIEDLWLMVYCRRGISGRPNARKDGKPIPVEKFKQFLNLTLKFLSDHDSYLIYIDSYLKNFYNLVEKDQIIESFDVSSERSFKIITEQLLSRKKTIEKRLIEEDSDSTTERTKLRGELDGINFALKTISINKA